MLAKYTPEIARFARGALARMRKIVPGAIELVYDNYNALAIGFGPSERTSEAVFSIALYPRQVNLFFLQGAGLPDSAKRLKGSGNVVRHVCLYTAGEPDAKVLDDPEIRSLINVALNRAKVPMSAGSRSKLIIRSVSARQRPRRPAPTKRRLPS